jgi:hypothetical protein
VFERIRARVHLERLEAAMSREADPTGAAIGSPVGPGPSSAELRTHPRREEAAVDDA